MTTTQKTTVTISAKVNAPVEKVWEFWTLPKHITKWNNASDDWHTPHASNDLRPEGKFSFRMEAKDGSFGFDFEGIYDKIKTNKFIDYTIADGRKVQIHFETVGIETVITECFEAEETNSVELQQGGWQSILNNFKKYTESN
ncbi:Activator of Hsp90 ATPase 1 family protein [Flavobacterium limnosediminis JC2902]|uniref:Activator of Hsp90 ATPase 1 family protein n=1 Tax=Flavobacterium limnosediminis JC2902 TaxID=1341181 RepID=V6SJX5_9FLAO|nr:SRPBCC family protein [Flavobacterium limnosediminis]ESU27013.1 Activator of Hsp90 ATPase 1 family protein [Flavobacterium limnosediminis JC2902]